LTTPEKFTLHRCVPLPVTSQRRESIQCDPASAPFVPNVQALFSRLPKSWSPPFKIFTVLARDERLLLRFTNAATSYLQLSHVTVRQGEVLLLRVTARCKCAYEWGTRLEHAGEPPAPGARNAVGRRSGSARAGDGHFAVMPNVREVVADFLARRRLLRLSWLPSRRAMPPIGTNADLPQRSPFVSH
jgi:hypothetical protein